MRTAPLNDCSGRTGDANDHITDEIVTGGTFDPPRLWRIPMYDESMSGTCGKLVYDTATLYGNNKTYNPPAEIKNWFVGGSVIPSSCRWSCRDGTPPSGISGLKVQFVNVFSSVLPPCVRSLCIPSLVLPVRWLLSIISSNCGNPFSGSVDPTKGLIES